MMPDYQKIMLPLLKLVADEEVHQFRKAVTELAEQFNLTEAEKNKLLPSGNDNLFANRVGWVKIYLKNKLKGGPILCIKNFITISLI